MKNRIEIKTALHEGIYKSDGGGRFVKGGREGFEMYTRNAPLIQVLKNGLRREYERIESAQFEIIKLELELAELGVELPLEKTSSDRHEFIIPGRWDRETS